MRSSSRSSWPRWSGFGWAAGWGDRWTAGFLHLLRQPAEETLNMWRRVAYYLDTWPWSVLTRPFAGMLSAGLAAAALGFICALLYGAAVSFAPLNAGVFFRIALAGAAAGFIAGLGSGIDRINWRVRGNDNARDRDASLSNRSMRAGRAIMKVSSLSGKG